MHCCAAIPCLCVSEILKHCVMGNIGKSSVLHTAETCANQLLEYVRNIRENKSETKTSSMVKFSTCNYMLLTFFFHVKYTFKNLLRQNKIRKKIEEKYSLNISEIVNSGTNYSPCLRM